MASLRPSSIRHLTTTLHTTRLLPAQRRWARVHDVRFHATHDTQARIEDRYRRLLEEKAQQEGYDGDISKLKEAYKDKISMLRQKAAVPGATAPLPQAEDIFNSRPSSASTPAASAWPNPPPAPESAPLDSISPTSPNHKNPAVKTLSSFIDVGKVLELPTKEIETIWRLRHASNPRSLSAAVPTKTWQVMYQMARRHPQFILPGLPRAPTEAEAADPAVRDAAGTSEGSPIHFLQWTFPSPDTVTVLFTHLAEYKLRGQYAQPHTTMTHHLELAGPKSLVLCQGNAIEGRGVSLEEGKWLLMCLQKFYTSQAPAEGEGQGIGAQLRSSRRSLLERFTAGDATFNLEELMNEAERIG